MLILQKGTCEKCGVEFGPIDTVQSTNVECAKCKEKAIVCRRCKDKGCTCGGKYLDAHDRNPGILY